MITGVYPTGTLPLASYLVTIITVDPGGGSPVQEFPDEVAVVLPYPKVLEAQAVELVYIIEIDTLEQVVATS